LAKKYNAKSNKNTSKSKGGYMLFKKKRRQDLPVDREWKEKNQEYIMELERFLDRTDSIKDEQLRREIIARMLICDKVLTELAEQKFLEKYNEGYKKGKNEHNI
jgi:hypothetical protein